jgi:hypothetical protein
MLVCRSDQQVQARSHFDAGKERYAGLRCSGFASRLLIGTHYDADHLEGFVPIINDMSIDITEAWLPPVANDTQAHMIDDPLDERNLLPLQFAADKGDQVVKEYFRSKRKDYSYLTRMQSQAEKAFEVEEIRGNSRREFRKGISTSKNTGGKTNCGGS